VFVGCRVALPTPCPPYDVHVPGRSPRSTSTHVFSHISFDAAAFRLQHRGCRDLPAPAPSKRPAPFGANHPAMSSTSRSSNTFRRQISRGAA
jgi:hypothetical protein